MKEFVITYFPYLLSLLTIYSIVLQGDKKRRGWALSILGQFLWLAWIITSKTWGLLPMNLALWWVYSRNYLKWRSEEDFADLEQRIEEILKP